MELMMDNDSEMDYLEKILLQEHRSPPTIVFYQSSQGLGVFKLGYIVLVRLLMCYSIDCRAFTTFDRIRGKVMRIVGVCILTEDFPELESQEYFPQFKRSLPAKWKTAVVPDYFTIGGRRIQQAR